MSKVLIIEDEEVLAKVLKEKFKEAKFNVSVAYDGEAGLAAAKKNDPDIILLDLMLPKKGGFEVLEELKASPNLSAVPVIVLSNLDQDEDIKKALTIGAADYFVKSQHAVKEIVNKVKTHLSRW